MQASILVQLWVGVHNQNGEFCTNALMVSGGESYQELIFDLSQSLITVLLHT
jgi:hypothetical protein